MIDTKNKLNRINNGEIIMEKKEKEPRKLKEKAEKLNEELNEFSEEELEQVTGGKSYFSGDSVIQAWLDE